jgi:hypothetical protein
MVTRIDRLARSIGDLQDIVRAVRAKGASLKAFETDARAGPIHFFGSSSVAASVASSSTPDRLKAGVAGRCEIQGEVVPGPRGRLCAASRSRQGRTSAGHVDTHGRCMGAAG